MGNDRERIIVFLIACLIVIAGVCSGAPPAEFKRHVVKIVSHDRDGAMSMGSGLHIGAGQILTACHVIRDASSVGVVWSSLGSSREHSATIVAKSQMWVSGRATDGSPIMDGPDVALLQVQNPESEGWSKASAIPVGGLAYVYGYPGGSQLKASAGTVQGVISETDFRVQATIESGASGGPIVSEDGSLIGIGVAGGPMETIATRPEAINATISRAVREAQCFGGVCQPRYSSPTYGSPAPSYSGGAVRVIQGGLINVNRQPPTAVIMTPRPIPGSVTAPATQPSTPGMVLQPPANKPSTPVSCNCANCGQPGPAGPMGPRGLTGLTGPKGDAGSSPSAADLQAAIAAYFRDNPIPPGVVDLRIKDGKLFAEYINGRVDEVGRVGAPAYFSITPKQ